MSISSREYARRRSALMKSVGRDGIAILPAAPERLRARASSKISSAGALESEQPRMMAGGSCLPASCPRRATVSAPRSVSLPSTKRRLPVRSWASVSMAGIMVGAFYTHLTAARQRSFLEGVPA